MKTLKEFAAGIITVVIVLFLLWLVGYIFHPVVGDGHTLLRMTVLNVTVLKACVVILCCAFTIVALIFLIGLVRGLGKKVIDRLRK